MPVRPEVWNGLQAKMAAAGLTSTATAAAAKGMSVLTKWIIGGTAAAVVGVTTTVLVLQSDEKPAVKKEQPVAAQTASIQPQQTPTPSAQEKLQQSTPAQTTTNYPMGGQVVLPDYFTLTPLDPPVVVSDYSSNRSAELPDVKPTIIPVNTEAPKVDFSAFPADEKQQKTPEETVSALPEEQVAAKETALVVPNVFTPDGDNINDEFFVTSANISDAEVIIQDGDNKIVYRSSDIHFRWNGRINGTDDPAAPGMYACVIIYKDETGKSKKNIQLLRLER